MTGPKDGSGSDDCHWQLERHLATNVRKFFLNAVPIENCDHGWPWSSDQISQKVPRIGRFSHCPVVYREVSEDAKNFCLEFDDANWKSDVIEWIEILWKACRVAIADLATKSTNLALSSDVKFGKT
jgi:hypothetical protein